MFRSQPEVDPPPAEKKVRAKVRMSPQIETSASEKVGWPDIRDGRFSKTSFCFATNWKGAEKEKWADLSVSCLKPI